MIRYIAAIGLACLAALLTVLIFALPTPQNVTFEATGSRTLIKNVRLVGEDGRLTEPVSILTDEGMITRIGDLSELIEANTIDGAGMTVLSGLIDSHTHTYDTSLEDALRFGVTTLLDMFTAQIGLAEARPDRTSLVATKKADLFSAGMLATAPGGHGTQFGLSIDTLTSSDEAVAWVAARKAEGSDYIKLVYMPGIWGFPSIDRAVAKAVIEASHAADLMAVAHISTHDGTQHMVEAGIDGLVHIFADRLVSDDLLELAKTNDVFIVPTLAVIASIDGDGSAAQLANSQEALLSTMQSQTLNASFDGGLPGFSLSIAMENVARFHDAGISILAGSDAPNPGTAHGVSLHNELQLLVRAGLTPAETLKAASSTPARLFQLDGRGVIAEGARADLILIDGDPTKDISATLNIRHILKNGFIVERSFSARPPGKALADELLGDFETGLSASEGLVWTQTTDGIAGGSSEVTLTRNENGAAGSNFALKIDAKVMPGFAFPWAGASIQLSPGAASGPVDISGYAAIHFDIKGTPGDYRVMAFSAGALGIPPTQTVEVQQVWNTQILKISDFSGFQADNMIGFSFVAGPELGESTIYLDNVKLVK